MKVQFGTVDGLVNIDEQNISLFVKAIKAFSDMSLASKSLKAGIPLGKAFQRFVDPVYKKESEDFDAQSIFKEVYTINGNPQTPARFTYCRKMGLLNEDDTSGIFELTPLGNAILTGAITVEEYALILISKMGVFVDDSMQSSGNVLRDVLIRVYSDTVISDEVSNVETLKNYIAVKYRSTVLTKTRLDIILNSVVMSGLIVNDGGGSYCINTTYEDIVTEIIKSKHSGKYAQNDTSATYSAYIGSLEGGIFDIIDESNRDIFAEHYPNIVAIAMGDSLPEAKAVKVSDERPDTFDIRLLSAMRTKPFILLAGISGTGKSRIVKQMAFETCHNIEDMADDKNSPGNYCLIEVKPNWHDSDELLGYKCHIKPQRYVVTPFVKFLVKAHLHPAMPFFACLDEMNLAPVEQYFAEFLSVLESRRDSETGITSEALISADIFANPLYEEGLRQELYHKNTNYSAFYDRLKKEGLRLPPNLVVVGTVNMDETTRQFSRKVIDRAMTIEMNINSGEQDFERYFENLSDPDYRTRPWSGRYFLPKFASSGKVLVDSEVKEWLKNNVPGRLAKINEAFEGTPFKIAYRVQNELILYFDSLCGLKPEKAADKESILNEAVDDILMMKILPRVIGDGDMLREPLKRLHEICKKSYPVSAEKIDEMLHRLDSSDVTSYWP